MDIGPFINYLTVFLDRIGKWFLMDETLSHFVCSGEIDKCSKIVIGIIDVSPENVIDRMSSFGLIAEKFNDDWFLFKCKNKLIELCLFSKVKKNIYFNKVTNKEIKLDWIVTSEENAAEIRKKRPEMCGNGLWRRQINEEYPYHLQLPYLYGTLLDYTLPNWFLYAPKREYPKIGDIFFNEERKKNGYKLIDNLYKCAEITGLSQNIFHGFGTMLGYLMYGDFIAKDRDIDTCILSDNLKLENIQNYVENIYKIDNQKPSRWEYSKRNDLNKYLWLSVGYKDPTTENGVKSCNWFFYSWNGFWLHSKGGRWVSPAKMNQKKIQYDMNDEAIALGQPKFSITDLIEVPFGETKIKIPTTPGICADWYYPGWSPRGEGASAHNIVIVHKKWEDENTWRIAQL